MFVLMVPCDNGARLSDVRQALMHLRRSKGVIITQVVQKIFDFRNMCISLFLEPTCMCRWFHMEVVPAFQHQ